MKARLNRRVVGTGTRARGKRKISRFKRGWGGGETYPYLTETLTRHVQSDIFNKTH